jgi:hypothetical protein
MQHIGRVNVVLTRTEAYESRVIFMAGGLGRRGVGVKPSGSGSAKRI